MNEAMTIRQIAETCGVDERTVQRWTRAATDKMSSIGDKMSSSSPMHPACFALEETIAIIRAGGRSTLADLLLENANGRQTTSTDISEVVRLTVREMVPAMTAAFVAAMKQIPGGGSLPQIESDYFSIKGYAAKRGVKVMLSDAIRLGREASRLSRAEGFEIRHVDDEQWGVVNSYHVSVLQEVFTV